MSIACVCRSIRSCRAISHPLAWPRIEPIDQTHPPPTTHQTTPQTIAIYGYSLCAFVPLTLLNFVPNNSVPWLSEIIAAGASAVFLVKALGPTVREKAPQQALPFLVVLRCVFFWMEEGEGAVIYLSVIPMDAVVRVHTKSHHHDLLHQHKKNSATQAALALTVKLVFFHNA